MRNISKLFRFTAVAAVIASVFAGCLSYSVDSVEVTIGGNATSVDAGSTLQFNFLVNASGKDTSGAQRVKWSVSSTDDGKGPVTPGTNVSPSGTLAVSPDEIYPLLYVRATHEYYSGKYDFKQIQVKGPKVGSVFLSVAGNAASAAAGGNLKLSAFVAGQAPNQGLTYSVGSRNDGTGAVVAGTAISADGTLTVSANETASSLYVKALSNSDATKFDIKEIKVVTVTGVTVTAEGGPAKVARGRSLKFTAAVTGNNSPANTVTWKVSSNAAGTGDVTSGTAIAGDGTLTVAATEAATTLYVIATSTLNTTKSGSVTVVIPTVTRVTVSPVNPTIKRGEGATFTARVQGTGDPSQEVTWKLDGVGGVPSAATITGNGMLIVSSAETLSGLIVTATSVDDPTKFGTSMITIPAVPAAVVPVTPAPQAPASSADAYIITGSGTAFTATRNGATIGTANQPIQNVITDIRTHAAGAACTIQFGNGTTTLDVGAASVTITTLGGGSWGLVTLTGKITGTFTSTNNQDIGVVQIRTTVSAVSTAEISNTNTAESSTALSFYSSAPATLTITGGKLVTAGSGGSSRAVYNSASGTINISGGSFEATGTGGVGVNNSSIGAVNISGGTVTVSGTGDGVYNLNTGTITISGGTIDAGRTGRSAAINLNRGKIVVSGTAVLTSANAANTAGTICYPYLNVPAEVRFEMTGGTVRNTSTGGNAILNSAKSASMNISGGTISAPNGNAINNSGRGEVTVGPNVRIEGNKVNVP